MRRLGWAAQPEQPARDGEHPEALRRTHETDTAAERRIVVAEPARSRPACVVLAGGKAAETVGFGLDGAGYEIDLSKKNAAALRTALAEFVEHARPVKATGSGVSGRAGKRPVPRPGPEPAVLREWAAAQGISVSARGRIPADVVARYDAAHA